MCKSININYRYDYISNEGFFGNYVYYVVFDSYLNADWFNNKTTIVKNKINYIVAAGTLRVLTVYYCKPFQK